MFFLDNPLKHLPKDNDLLRRNKTAERDNFSKLDWEVIEKHTHSSKDNDSSAYGVSVVERAKVFDGCGLYKIQLSH